MPTTLWEFQDLFFVLRDEAGDGWGGELLQPWIDARPHVLEELHELGRPDSRRVRVPRDGQYYTTLEGLYALGRVVDVLIAPHQPVNDDPAVLDWTTGKPWWRGAMAAESAWPQFCEMIGAVAVDERSFHPFFHEIVLVQPSDDAEEPPSLTGEFWPGAIVGGLLLARAGVAVRAGANHLDAGVAARSCLYWAWWRRNRKAADLSHGWGHNSQWGTDFRRDYVAEGHLHYNVDANATGRRRDELDDADLLDLLRHRCSIRTDLGWDQWPYDATFIEPAP